MEGRNIPLQENIYDKPEEMNQNENTPFTNDQMYAPPPMEQPSYGVPPPQPMQNQNYAPISEPTPNNDITTQQQPQYGQPIANAVPSTGMPNAIVINQQSRGAMVNPNVFKTSPISITCTFCSKPITTTVKEECNCLAFCLCCFTGVIFYLIIQACRDKDLCFDNATHTCPYCGNVVGTYNAC
jgi:hypothetical protein